MFGLRAFSMLGAARAAAAGGVAPITVSSPWGGIGAIAPASANNTNRTLTVPAGTGTVRLDWVDNDGIGATIKYRRNSGAYTEVPFSGNTFAVADADTLNFQVTGPYAVTPGTIDVEAWDDDAETLIGAFQITVS